MSDVDKAPKGDIEYFDDDEDGKNISIELADDEDNALLESDSSNKNEGNINSKNTANPNSKTNIIAQDTLYQNEDKEEQVGTKPNPNGFFAETKSEKACSV